MTQLEMLIEDMKNENIRIEIVDSEKRIRFVQNECKHFEAPFAGQHFRPMLFQKA